MLHLSAITLTASRPSPALGANNRGEEERLALGKQAVGCCTSIFDVALVLTHPLTCVKTMLTAPETHPAPKSMRLSAAIADEQGPIGEPLCLLLSDERCYSTAVAAFELRTANHTLPSAVKAGRDYAASTETTPSEIARHSLPLASQHRQHLMPPFNLRALGRAAGIARRREYIQLAPPALARAAGVTRQHHPSVRVLVLYDGDEAPFHVSSNLKGLIGAAVP